MIVMCTGQPVTQHGTTNSTATCNYSALSVGAHANVTAVYNPGSDPNYLTVTSPPMTPAQVVNQATPTAVVTSTPNPSNYSQQVTFTATLTGPSGQTQPTGTVDFKDGTIVMCTGQPVTQHGTTNSTATCNYSALTGGTHANITATYVPGTDPNYLAVTSPPMTPPQVVNPVVPTAIVNAIPNPSTYGQQVVFTATLTGPSGQTQPTGTVDFKDGTVVMCTAQPLTQHGTTNSTATCNYIALTVGSHLNIVAVYNPGSDPNYLTVTSPVMSPAQVVNKATPTATVSSSLNPSTFGQQVIFTATVAGTNGVVQPTGTVDFKDGSVVLCSAQGLTPNGTTNSTATCNYSALSVGTHANITAVYNPVGDPNYLTVTSPAMTPPQVVNQATPTAVVTSTPNPSNYSQQVTFTATLTGPSGQTQPTGTVDFKDGTIVMCTGQPVTQHGTTNSTATCSYSMLTGGTHANITAVYNPVGDPNYLTVTSPTMTPPQVVNQATPTAVVTSTPNPSNYSQQVTFTATLTGPSGQTQPTGTVDFKDGTIVMCTGQPVTQHGTTNSTATCSYSMLTGGTHANITAVYNPVGDPNYLTVTSPAMTPPQVVNQATPTAVVTSTPNPSNYSQQVTFTATLTGPSGQTQPTGTVDFKDGTIVMCTGQPVTQHGTTNSTATCSYSMLTGGTHANITAVYNPVGDPNYLTVTSPTMTPPQVVNQATPTAVVTSTPNPSNYSQQVTFTATLTGPSGQTQPTGTVDFKDGTIVMCTGQPVTQHGTTNSTATCSYSMLTGGTHANITAVYNPVGDPNYLTVTSPTMTPPQVVNQATPTAVVTSTPNPSNYSQQVTFTATLTGPSGQTQPTGTVDFKDGTIVMCTGQPVTQHGTTNSTATCSYSALTGGTHTGITAIYNPGTDPNYLTVTSPAMTPPQVVNLATPTVAVTSTPNPSVYGTQVVFTATVTGINGFTQPTGGVDFKDGATFLCTGQVLTQHGTTNSTATCNYSTLTGGTHANVTAVYNPGSDPNYLTATSPAYHQVVNTFIPAVAVMSDNNPSTYGQQVVFTAKVTGVTGDALPTGMVSFTDAGQPIATCTSVALTAATTASIATCTTNAPNMNLLSAGTHSNIQATYNADINYGSVTSPAFPQTVKKFPLAPTVALSGGSKNPSSSTQSVQFTATVTALPAGTVPMGSVTFTDNFGSQSTPLCTNAPLTMGVNSSTAQCTASVPNQNDLVLAGTHSIVATYNGDTNYAANSSSGLAQLVQDFGISSSPTTAVAVTQGSSNTSNPFTVIQTGMTVATAPLSITPNFSDALGLTCMVTPAQGQPIATVPTCVMTPPPASTTITCSVDPNTQLSSCAFPGQGGMATVTVNAAASTPIGQYNVTITAVDQVVPTLQHNTVLLVNVINNTSAVNVIPGNIGSTTANFTAPPTSGNVSVTFDQNSCYLVTGTGLNTNIGAGGQPPSTIGISCTFTSASVNQTTITVNGTTTTPLVVNVNTNAAAIAMLRYPSGIFAATSLGLPAIVLLGSLGRKRRSRMSLLQLLGILLVLVALLQGIGCGGGGFIPPATVNGTPTGAYQLLVQSSNSSDGLTYYAIVPVNVGH